MAPERSKLSIHVLPAVNKGEGYHGNINGIIIVPSDTDATDSADDNATQPRPIDDIIRFRKSLSLYPLPDTSVKL